MQSGAQIMQKVCKSLHIHRQMYVNEKIGVCKTCAKNIIAKLRENVAKLIETDKVNILVSADFQKRMIFYC